MTAATRGQAARLAAWSSFLALVLRLLHGPTFGRLSIPLDSVDQLVAWADHTSPTVMALAVVRLGALVAAWYLTFATILAVVADVAGWRRLAAVVAALSPSLVRRLASRTAGVGLAAGALLAVTPMPQRLVATPADATAATNVASPNQPPAATTSPPLPARRAGPHTPPPSPVGAASPSPGRADPSSPAPGTGQGAPPALAPSIGQAVLPSPEHPARPVDATATMTRLPDPASADAGASADVDHTPGNANTRPPVPTATMTRLPPSAPTPHPTTTSTTPTASGHPTRDQTTTTRAPDHPPTGRPPAPTTTATPPGHRATTSTPPPATTTPSRAGESNTAEPPGTTTTATMTHLPPATAPGHDATATMVQVAWPDHAEPQAASPAPREPAPEPWTVGPGDSFWSIAEEILTDIAGHEPTEQAVRRYWLQLIETNRRRLADPANADLLIPGQLLDIPEPT